jgi:glycosyltransferase involved in cell wall biosynthesis
MRIAHVVATFPPHIGGMGQVVWDEAKALAERGHEVKVFTLAYPGFSYLNDAPSFKIERLHPFIKSGDAGWVPQLFFKLKDFDVVHLHYPFYGGAEWVWLANLFKRQKYVVTYHMQAAPQSWFKAMVATVYDLFFKKAILGWAQKVLVVDQNYFVKFNPAYFPTDQLVELSNPIDTNLFKPSDARATDVGLSPEWENKAILLFVGNLMPVKRLDLLIDAMAQLAIPPSQGGSRGVLDIRLLVVGGGYEEARYKKMVIEKKLSDYVKFVGRIEDKEKLAQYYNVATATVVPSDAESFSLVVVESLACGTPVVASDIPGIQGRIENGKNGFLFKAGSVESLLEQLQKVLVLSPEERSRMGELGRAKVLEKYSVAQHVDRLEKIYQSI